jgi:cytochrome c oxidase subunit 2
VTAHAASDDRRPRAASFTGPTAAETKRAGGRGLPRRGARRLALAAGVAAGAVLLGGCQVPTFGAFRGATVQAHDEFKLWSGMAVAGIAVAVLVWGLIFWAVFRYRRRDDRLPRQFHENIPIEILYTVIPLVIVLVIFAFTVVTENEVDALSPHPAAVVRVVAFQWGWRFEYEKPGGGTAFVVETTGVPQERVYPATSSQYPQLVLPEGVPTRIVLVSNDVVHGFYVPEFNFSRYALPGVTNRFDFTPTRDGVFRGQCTQFCGLYHSEMLFSVRVVPLSAFRSWYAAQLAQAASSAGVAA